VNAQRFTVQRETTGYSVWTTGLSGSKQDCLGHFNTKRAALAFIRRQRGE
jgi:hypothetical protein